MENINIISTGSYLPKIKMENKTFAKALGVTEEFLLQRTGIHTRYFVRDETMTYMAVELSLIHI